jgi:hypothetical protein
MFGLLDFSNHSLSILVLLGLGLIQPGDFSSYPQIEIAMNFMLNSE